MAVLTKKKGAKVITNFKPMIRSRHPSHKHLRAFLPLLPFRSVIRLGSEWGGDGKQRVEINSVQSVKNSASKLLMKHCFTRGNVKTAEWWLISANNAFKDGNLKSAPIFISKLPFPIIAKPLKGSRGNGIELLNDERELNTFIKSNKSTNYIFEKYYNFTREYRLHVSKDGCFYTCRKMLKSDTPKGQRFIRNDKTCVWILEDNPSFNKPNNWNDIVSECVKALKAVGLDVGGFDVRVQGSDDGKGRTRKNPDFIIIESNSACSHGDKTAIKYREILPKLLRDKKNAIY